MNIPILNRDFTHPSDGWYNIEAKGEHPNAAAKVVQVIDDAACASIVNRFNAEAVQPGFAGMLIDHEHFRHDDDKETIAYGWLERLENRADGIYGKIRWTGIGQKSVDGGEYRFFSTEYAAPDLEVLNKGKSPKQIRPLKLAGLTLTNVNNNKGQRPITNRHMKNKETEIPEIDESKKADAVAASKKANDASGDADSPREHEKAAVLHRKAQKLCADCGKEQTAEYHGDMADDHDTTAEKMRSGVKNRDFPPGSAGPDRPQKQNDEIQMNTVIKKLGLPENADEPAVLGAVTKLLNRNTQLEAADIDNVLTLHAKRFDPKQRDFIKAALITNREGTIEFLKAQPEHKEAVSPQRLHNRDTASPVDRNAGGNADDARARSAEAEGLISEYRAANPKVNYERARNVIRNRKPELFGLPAKAA